MISRPIPFAFSCLLLAIAGLTVARADSAPPLNVLFIAVDDLKPSIGAYGDPMAVTPNLDRLSDSGITFLNNHCQQAICGASRASIMTGMRPDSTRVWLFGQRMREINPDTLTIPQHFMNEGYTTTAVGKIFDPRCVNGKYDPESWSIPHKTYSDLIWHPDYPKPVNGSYHNAVSKEAYEAAVANGLEGYKAIDQYLRQHNGRPAVEATDVPDNAYKDGAIALRAIEMLKDLDQAGKPFFLAVGFVKPHLPFVAPQKYWDLYDRKKVRVHPFQNKSSHPVDKAYHGSGELKGYSDIPNTMNSYSDDATDFLAEEKQVELIHGYYACTSYVDAQVGKLLDALEACGQADNTVVILWGDHGFHLGDHGLWHKHTNLEQATRSPLMIRAPGFDQPLVARAPTEFVDVFPTLCELAGIPTPETLDGKSLVPMMSEADVSIKPFAVSQYPYEGCMGYSIRTDRYRYTEWLHDWRTSERYSPDLVRGRELYDYEKDPMETMNRVDDPEHSEILKGLQDQMYRFFEESRLKQNS